MKTFLTRTVAATPLLLMALIVQPAAAADDMAKPIAEGDRQSLGSLEISVEETIGQAVMNLKGERLGEIRDLLIRGEDRVVLAVIGVGGFLGVGERDVAVSYDNLVRVGDTIYLYGADKESLEALPAYEGDSGIFSEWAVDADVRRQVYERRMAESFDDWQARIDTTAKRTGEAASDNVQSAWNEVKEQWNKLESASGEAWNETRDGLETAWDRFLGVWSEDEQAS